MHKKSLGQNFLSDPKILKKIADFAQIKKGDTVVEIGPGEGSLTKFLLERAKEVILIEKDAELARKLNIEPQDILEVDPNAFPKGYVLVGNIPYYITGEIFRKFLESENQPASMTFVIQKEVADRIMARDKKESILSLSVKAYGTPELGGIIKAGSFTPAPKVDSTIIAVRNINKNKFSQVSEKTFFDFVKRGFAHKRKLLRKNLGISPEILESVGVDKDIRAEDLTLENWFDIIRACQVRK